MESRHQVAITQFNMLALLDNNHTLREWLITVKRKFFTRINENFNGLSNN